LLGAVADRCNEQQLREEDGILDNLTSFAEVLMGFKASVCSRSLAVRLWFWC
jgi:hypothetical protein